jgi:hypothetical protein
MTGLGSMVVEAGVVKSPGFRVTVTGMVMGTYLLRVKATLKLPSVVTGTEQGVLQLGPREVRASAPGGIESSCTLTVGGGDLNESRENEENELQPAKPRLAAAITMTRRMVHPSLTVAAYRRSPGCDHRSVRPLAQPSGRSSLIFG